MTRVPEDPFWKKFAAEASRVQIAVDVFAFPSQYMDLASLGALCKYTCGQLYYYPQFNATQDAPKLRHELHHNLTRTTGECRVSCVMCILSLMRSVLVPVRSDRNPLFVPHSTVVRCRQAGRRSCASGAARASASTAFTGTSSSGPPTCWRCRKCAPLRLHGSPRRAYPHLPDSNHPARRGTHSSGHSRGTRSPDGSRGLIRAGGPGQGVRGPDDAGGERAAGAGGVHPVRSAVHLVQRRAAHQVRTLKVCGLYFARRETHWGYLGVPPSGWNLEHASASNTVMSVHVARITRSLRVRLFAAREAFRTATSKSDRRLRVHTMSLPAVGELHQLYAAADEGAIAALLAKLAVEKSYVAKLDETRQVRLLCISLLNHAALVFSKLCYLLGISKLLNAS